MNTAETLLNIGGVFNLAFAIFHLLFWRIFRWRKELSTLSFINRAIVQVLNLCLTFVFVIFAYVSFIHTRELLVPGLGRSLVALIAAFWLLRAIEQVVFFRLRHWASWAFLASFLGGSGIYAAALATGSAALPGEQSCAVLKRETFDSFFSGQKVRPQPVYRNGQLYGWRLYEQHDSEVLPSLGLRVGDLVTHFCGVPLPEIIDGREETCCSKPIGGSVDLTLVRDGESVELEAPMPNTYEAP